MFFCSDHGQNILTEDSLLIHIETGNIFYDSFNINENFCNFLLAQQDESKKFIDKTISYHGQFEKYIKQDLSAFTVDEIDKYDFAINKNSKKLLYRFIYWIDSLGVEKIKIRHSSTVKEDAGVLEIQKKVAQFLIEKIIGDTERSNPYNLNVKKPRNNLRN